MALLIFVLSFLGNVCFHYHEKKSKMVPKPQEQLGEKISQPAPGDDVGDKVVISGIAGLFPDSYDVKQLSEILYNKKNPIRRTDRWDFNHPEVSQYAGNIPDPAHFDAQFFKVHYRLCNLMDPMSRKLLEQTYQAIFDSGYSPESLSGKKIGVYIGTCFSETEKACLYLPNVKSGLCIAGCNRSMFANRISYYLNLKGPSMSIDVSCTSSASALEMAYSSISRGECDGAIVGGANLCLHPQTVIHYGRAIDICMDGKTKSFDANADGCSKSEAINVVFLQKAKDALRIYAYVVHAKCEYLSLPECETGAKYGFHSRPADLIRFFRTFYKEANVSPQDVQYVEAFGSANRDSDKLELDMLDEIFCKDRNEPLMVGSVMSNIGYVEAASATTSLTKVLLGYHHGKLAGNLHYKTPRDDIAAIRDGRIEVLADNKEFVPTYTAINGMSITGNMAHILLHGYYKKKDLNKYKSSIPRIVLCSGRQESSVKKIIDELKSRPIDPEEHALLHNFHEERTTGHLGRGYVILDTNEDNETVALSEDIKYFDEGKRPLWFVYSGMGSQWAGMGKDLMRIPVFAAAIEKCHRVLEPRGVNIIDIITSNDKNIFDNILHSFVGINAIQIGLTDVLRAVDITPDMIIGHSMGEICCAYADGCFTAEEAILCAYSRGLVSIQTPFIHGSMAAVGLGFKEISKICPPEIEVACHNSAESCTISGPAKIMGEFVASLVEQGIFAKEVACSNIAYHSRYVADAAPALLQFMQDLIKTPRPRSSRWVSTSVPQDRWDEPLAKYSSPEYHLNNLVSPVLFEEAMQLIPSDAVLIEIAPHGLLQAILKRSLPETCLNLPLTRRGHAKGCQYLLEAIGKLYMEGFIPKVKGLYPQVEFPVSTSTPMLSHLVEWAHQEIWFLPLPSALTIRTAAESKTAISIFDPEHSYLTGHVMRGNNLYSFSAALVYVWDTLAASLSLKPKSISVQFENVHFYSQPLLHKQRQLLISVAIHKGTGQFEVLSEKSLIVKGTIIHEITGARKEQNACTTDMNVCKGDVYRFLHARDYHYHDDFRSIHSVNEYLTEAQIEWKDNWVTFLDGIIQLNFIRRKHHTVSKLNFTRKITIDVNKQDTSLVTHDNKVLLNAQILELDDSTICGGVVMENLKFVDQPPLCDDGFILETPELFPSTHFETIKKSSGKLHYLPLDDAYINEDNNNKYISPCSILRIGQIGDVDSLYWIKTSPRDVTGVEIEVSYAGVNVVFVNKLLGSIFNETEERNKSVIDFSGVSKSGTRVMGMVRSDSISTQVSADPEFLLPVPWHWTLEDAATVPLCYSLAFYILFVKVNITKNYPLLIQGGAGALGQALISIALAHGCEVFTTVSSNSKKQFLQKLFPQLQDDHIGCSRDISFVDCILSATEGNGCQLVVSCSKDQNKNFLLQCLGFNGVLVDPTVIHNHEDFNYGMNYLTKQRGYLPIDLSAIFQPKYIEDARQIRDLMIDGIRRGYVRPLSRVTFAAEEAARACRMQAARCNRGRVLLDLQQVQSSVQSRVEFANSSWNLIISDNEILALKLGERLVKRGATKLLFILCNVSRCVDIQSRLWETEGIEVKLIKAFWKGMNLCKIIEESNYDGGLESVFIITSNEKAMDMKNIVKNFSAFISKLCSSIKYFAVISSFKEESESFFTSLANDDITLIKIQGMNLVCDDICENNEKLTVNNAIDAIEKALCSHKKMILAHSYTAPRKTLLQQIFKIADLTVEDDITNDSTLSELYLDDSKLLAIQGYLQDIYEVYISIEEIQKLTIQSIKEIERKCVVSDFSETRGVERYFPKLYTDELLYSTEIIVMSTLASTNMSDYINTEDAYLCIIPGVEGHYSRFTEFCKRLKLPALTLQPGLDHPNETVTEQANRYVQILSRKAVLKDNFYLLGYESGALVALEMADVLEKRGLAGTIFCVGGSPEDIIADYKNSLNEYRSNEELEMAVLKNAYSLITSEKTDALDELCKNLKWSDKINICTDTFKGKFPYSIQYTRKWIDLMYSKLTSLLRYIPEIKRLKSQIIYLRTQVTATDSILQDRSEKNVISYQLEAPLSSALQDLSCTSIVNQYLHSDIKSKFNNRNICITYQVATDGLNATS